MDIKENNLKKIIRYIEEYGAIEDISIINSSVIVCHCSAQSNPKPSKVTEVDLNKANTYKITFKMGDIKENYNNG